MALDVATMEPQILDAIELIRPALQSDGGDIVYRHVDDDGVVHVTLVGACGTCPVSTMTLKAAGHPLLGSIEVSIEPKAESAKLDVQVPGKMLPGDYLIYAEGQAKLKYQNDPEGAKAADAAAKEAAKNVEELAAGVKKADIAGRTYQPDQKNFADLARAAHDFRPESVMVAGFDESAKVIAALQAAGIAFSRAP